MHSSAAAVAAVSAAPFYSRVVALVAAKSLLWRERAKCCCRYCGRGRRIYGRKHSFTRCRRERYVVSGLCCADLQVATGENSIFGYVGKTCGSREREREREGERERER